MAKIVTIYGGSYSRFRLLDMSHIRWLKISEALARLDHMVDIATNEPRWLVRRSPLKMGENLRRIPLSKVDWNYYDVVKTLFHKGFETLERYNGINHPFIISKLGSVVGPQDMDGIYFYGKTREWLYAMQEKINVTSRYITVLTGPAKELWEECFGKKDNILIVPGAADAIIPQPNKDPYPKKGAVKCIFAGNIYDKWSQPEANAVLVKKLNTLGKLLYENGAQLYMVGTGDITKLNKKYVVYLGAVPYDKSWNYLYFADVSIVVSAGKFMHNNESTKIYHYLRAGLPVVSESGFPNDNVVRESKLGFVVESGNLNLMAGKIIEAAKKDWNKEYAVNYIIKNHTWDERAKVYDSIIKKNLR